MKNRLLKSERERSKVETCPNAQVRPLEGARRKTAAAPGGVVFNSAVCPGSAEAGEARRRQRETSQRTILCSYLKKKERTRDKRMGGSQRCGNEMRDAGPGMPPAVLLRAPASAEARYPLADTITKNNALKTENH